MPATPKNPIEVFLGVAVLTSGLMCFLGDGGRGFLTLFVGLVIAASFKKKTQPGR